MHFIMFYWQASLQILQIRIATNVYTLLYNFTDLTTYAVIANVYNWLIKTFITL